ncbi:phage antirepressor N-terminal domain-containing protein [Providencia rettgeri]|uniref:phage antirepressor N-terminal domain-containing protein n=1 Tax=Providencia rettgeri TaxID=587 RepID=UPI0029121066|nr:phage antirepressor Ant [Providencia rettgeri]EMA4647338.1 phage antirepressor Ant [Providencia rettgeri]WRR98700.1 phage antirepressor N-terminal domain-containing protein [Providencia rettgeri]
MNTISTINVPFHGNNLYVVNYNGQPYVPMRPIVEGMGMDWTGQLNKLKQKFKSTVEEISIVAADGKERNMICLALRKLAGWLHTISPNKVKPEIRDKVIQYQEECDDVLYEYWTTGEVKAKHKSTVQERNPLKNAVNLLVSKKGIMYPEAYSLVHQQFNVSGIDELTVDQIPMAVEYVHKLVMEGEYIPKQESLDTPSMSFTEEEMLSIVQMCNAANQMRQSANDMYPAFVEFGSRFTGAIYDMKCEHGFKVKNGAAILFNKLKSAGLTGRIWETTISNLERSLA